MTKLALFQPSSRQAFALVFLALAMAMMACTIGQTLSPGDVPAGTSLALAATAQIATLTAQAPSDQAPTQPTSPGQIVIPGALTLADNGRTIAMQPGEQFLLFLGDDYLWNVAPADPGILSRDEGKQTIEGAQGVYVARAPGTTALNAVGDPACRLAEPPCLAPSISFTVNVEVQGGVDTPTATQAPASLTPQPPTATFTPPPATATFAAPPPSATATPAVVYYNPEIQLPRNATAIRFNRGSVSSTVSLRLERGDEIAFSLRALGGQTLYMLTNGNDVFVQVYTSAGRAITRAKDEPGPWSVRLPFDDDYRIAIEGRGRVTLGVYVPPLTPRNHAPAPLPTNVGRLRFERGEDSLKFNTNLANGVPRAYLLGALARQTLFVDADGDLVVAVLDPDGRALQAEDWERGYWEFYLPTNGDYTLVALGEGNAAVEIIIPPR